MLIVVGFSTLILALLVGKHLRLRKAHQETMIQVEQKTAEARRAASKCEQTLLAIGDAVLLVDVQGQVEMLNRAAEALLGWRSEEAAGQYYSAIYRTELACAAEHVEDYIGDILNSKGIPTSSCRTHTVITSKSGEELEIIEQVTPLLDEDDQLLAVLVVFRELTSLEAQQKRIAQLTYRDSLTGLYNRVYFDQELPRMDRQAYWPLSVLFADLNGLKLTNDIFGHSMGDALLLEVSRVFTEICRPQDRVFRWGGDEFIILMPRTDAAEANEMRERLRQELEGRVVGSMKLSVPIGLSTKEDASQDIYIVVQQAEEEMYWKKAISQSNYQSETLQRIINELHEKSEGEREHAERVQAMAMEFGEHLGLAPHEMRKLQYAAFLHDIGKVVLDTELLHKPFPLEQAEEHEMKRHPLVGFRLLNFFEETMELASAVLAHHEHWNGNGYPKGLKGEEIPLLGRILAIIETYDRALNEPVTEGFSPRQALNIIVEGSGKKFDPNLVSAFVDMMESKLAE